MHILETPLLSISTFLPKLRYLLSKVHHQQPTDWITSSSVACQNCIIHILARAIIQRHTLNLLTLLLVSLENSLQEKKSKSLVCYAKSFIIWFLFNTSTSSCNSPARHITLFVCPSHIQYITWALSSPCFPRPPCPGSHYSLRLEHIAFPLSFTLWPTII